MKKNTWYSLEGKPSERIWPPPGKPVVWRYKNGGMFVGFAQPDPSTEYLKEFLEGGELTGPVVCWIDLETPEDQEKVPSKENATDFDDPENIKAMEDRVFDESRAAARRMSRAAARRMFGGSGKLVKNINNGDVYEILTAFGECKTNAYDGDRLVIYTEGKNIYLRLFDEFCEKFVTVPDCAPVTPEWLEEGQNYLSIKGSING